MQASNYFFAVANPSKSRFPSQRHCHLVAQLIEMSFHDRYLKEVVIAPSSIPLQVNFAQSANLNTSAFPGHGFVVIWAFFSTTIRRGALLFHKKETNAAMATRVSKECALMFSLPFIVRFDENDAGYIITQHFRLQPTGILS